MKRSHRMRAIGAAVVGAGALAAVALATGPTGAIDRENLTPFPPGSSLSETWNVNTDGFTFSNDHPATVVFQKVVYAPGADSGWHLHPGLVFVSVTGMEGAQVTRYVGCTSKTYQAGQSFIENGQQPAGKILNTGSVHATLYAMFVVPVGDSLSDPTVPAPAC
jgi:quercetin dioxygenase-like cupin family protein